MKLIKLVICTFKTIFIVTMLFGGVSAPMPKMRIAGLNFLKIAAMRGPISGLQAR